MVHVLLSVPPRKKSAERLLRLVRQSVSQSVILYVVCPAYRTTHVHAINSTAIPSVRPSVRPSARLSVRPSDHTLASCVKTSAHNHIFLHILLVIIFLTANIAAKSNELTLKLKRSVNTSKASHVIYWILLLAVTMTTPRVIIGLHCVSK